MREYTFELLLSYLWVASALVEIVGSETDGASASPGEQSLRHDDGIGLEL